jgi:putative membrane protein
VSNINYIKRFAHGLIFGATGPIPGVSAGTLAVFLNRYEEFFDIISVDKIKKNFPLFICFLLGCVGGLLGISQIIAFLLDSYRQIILFCFIGLILGCMPMVYKKAQTDPVHPGPILAFIFALFFMMVIIPNNRELLASPTLQQPDSITFDLLARFFLSCLIGGAATLIPGLGASIVMLAFGTYTTYIEAISTFNPALLFVLVIGTSLGLLMGFKLIRKMIHSCSQILYGAILAFMIGSIFIIFPGFSMDIAGLLSLILATLFAVLAYRLSQKEG